ncbi:T9SS type A sorting domain-containing protein [Bacteroidales bacterium OttesenSCG-928-I21]|nr:T9SS type A sorting domain-containing protein [Bacteroidales bacterium OttesenSCG-928-I21]
MIKRFFLCLAVLVVSFSITFADIVSPTLYSPDNNATSQDVSLSIRCYTIAGSNSYVFECDTSPQFNSSLLYSGEVLHGSSSNSYRGVSLSNLLYGTKYYWRAKACHESDTSGWSPARDFTTRFYPAFYSPDNNATSQDVSLSINCYTIAGSNSYVFECDTSPQFNSSLLYSGEVLHGSSSNSYRGVSLSNLLYGTKYYWRAKACHESDTSGWSPARSFTTIPYPSLYSPNNNVSNQNISLSLQCYSIIGSNSYVFECDTSSQFNSSLLYSGETSDNYSGVSVSNLLYGTKYYWRAKACHAADTSEWSLVRNFTTIYQLTTPPVLVSPENNSTGINWENPVLTWDPIDNVTGYRYQISTDASFNNIERVGTVSLTFVSLNLTPSTTYYWRVQGFNEAGYSVWSGVWNFTTEDVVLTAPLLTSPQNQTDNIDPDVTLTWGSVFGATGYVVNISTDNTFESSTSMFSTAQLSQSVGELSEGETYYWRVKAINLNSESNWSNVWSFTVYICEDIINNISISACDSYSWNDILYTESGDYQQIFDIEDGCDSIVNLYLTIINIVPDVILENYTLVCTQERAEYQWINCDNGNSPIDGETESSFTPVVSGNYAVIVSIGECTATSTCFNIVITNVPETGSDKNIKCFPNPTSGEFTVEGLSSGEKINIFDLSGKYLKEFISTGKDQIIDISDFENGIYFIIIENNSSKTINKIIKE